MSLKAEVHGERPSRVRLSDALPASGGRRLREPFVLQRAFLDYCLSLVTRPPVCKSKRRTHRFNPYCLADFKCYNSGSYVRIHSYSTFNYF